MLSHILEDCSTVLVRSPRPNLKGISLRCLTGPNDETLLQTLPVRKARNLVLLILKLLVLLKVIRTSTQLVHSLLVPHHQTLVTLQHVLVMEALEVLTTRTLLGRQKMNLRELVLGKEVLKGLKTLLKRLLIHTVIDPQIDMLQLLLIRCRIGLLLDQADKLLETQRGRIDLAIQNQALLSSRSQFSNDMLKARKRLSVAARQSIVKEDGTNTVQLGLDIAREHNLLALLVIILC